MATTGIYDPVISQVLSCGCIWMCSLHYETFPPFFVFNMSFWLHHICFLQLDSTIPFEMPKLSTPVALELFLIHVRSFTSIIVSWTSIFVFRLEALLSPSYKGASLVISDFDSCFNENAATCKNVFMFHHLLLHLREYVTQASRRDRRRTFTELSDLLAAVSSP